MRSRTTYISTVDEDGMPIKVGTYIGFSHGLVYMRSMGKKLQVKESLDLFKLMDGSVEGDYMTFKMVELDIPYEKAIEIRDQLKIGRKLGETLAKGDKAVRRGRAQLQKKKRR